MTLPAFHPPQQPPGDEAEGSAPKRLFALAAWEALILLAALLLFSLVAAVSRQTTTLTDTLNALPGVSVATVVVLLLVYPLWPGRLLGGDPLTKTGRWLLLRVVEIVILLAVALPFLVAAAIYSGEAFSRLGSILFGLLGTATVAVLYRFAHQAGSRRLRAVALLDVIVFLFVPLAVGYLALEFYDVSIGWGWTISPLALGCDLAIDGLKLWSPEFYLGVVGYTIAALLGLLVAKPLAARFNEERLREMNL